jgi:prepilin-type N-terminal cleavage/methylation domain-containing protein
MRCSGRAFTLVEMLVVVTIIGLMMSILAPTFISVTDLSREAACKNNLSLMSKASFAYMAANTDRLPWNDPKNKTVTYGNVDPNTMLPGTDSTPKWWCNKIYTYGSRALSVYICPSDPGRASAGDPVQCGYGFNNTLTNPSPGGTGTDAAGLGYRTLFELTDPERTAMIGHCGDIDRTPAIIEGMADASNPAYWPTGHMKRSDSIGMVGQTGYVRLGVVGRCGFVMGTGVVKVRRYSEVLQLKNTDGSLITFRGPK